MLVWAASGAWAVDGTWLSYLERCRFLARESCYSAWSARSSSLLHAGRSVVQIFAWQSIYSIVYCTAFLWNLRLIINATIKSLPLTTFWATCIQCALILLIIQPSIIFVSVLTDTECDSQQSSFVSREDLAIILNGRSPQRQNNFSSSLSVATSSEAQPSLLSSD
jgi:hypothetical protein